MPPDATPPFPQEHLEQLEAAIARSRRTVAASRATMAAAERTLADAEVALARSRELRALLIALRDGFYAAGKDAGITPPAEPANG